VTFPASYESPTAASPRYYPGRLFRNFFVVAISSFSGRLANDPFVPTPPAMCYFNIGYSPPSNIIVIQQSVVGCSSALTVGNETRIQMRMSDFLSIFFLRSGMDFFFLNLSFLVILFPGKFLDLPNDKKRIELKERRKVC